jgi:hypothetical protein
MAVYHNYESLYKKKNGFSSWMFSSFPGYNGHW